MGPEDEFDVTDVQFDQYMAESEPVTLVDPPLTAGARRKMPTNARGLTFSIDANNLTPFVEAGSTRAGMAGLSPTPPRPFDKNLTPAPQPA